MIEKNVCSIDCIRKNSYFRLALLAFYNALVYLSRALTLDNKCKLFRQFPHNSFRNKKSRWKIQVNVVTSQELKMVNVVTSQELKMVCGESNEKKMVKNFLCSKKHCLLLIRSKKIVCLSWESKKSLSRRKTTSHHYQMIPSLRAHQQHWCLTRSICGKCVLK